MQSFTIVGLTRRCALYDMYTIKKNGEEMILKKLRKVIFQDEVSTQRYRDILDEIMRIEHPNISTLYDFKEDDHNFYLIVELCKGGNLFRRLSKQSELTENIAAEVTRQILSVLVFIHSKELIFGDLTLGSVLLEDANTNMNEQPVLKVIDLEIQQALLRSNAKCHAKVYPTLIIIASLFLGT